MLQKVNTVFVGKKFVIDADPNPTTVGDVYVVNAETGAGIDVTTAIPTTVNAIQIAYVKPNGTVSKSAVIKKNGITSITPNSCSAYIAPTPAKVEIDLTNVSVTAGNRYVIRVIYKDLYEHAGQFTHSYEYIASTTSIADFGAAIVARVNKHAGARCTAAYGSNKITLTAKSVVDNGFGTQGKEAITPYSQVQMGCVVYNSNPDELFSAKKAVAGIVITITEADPGYGNAYIVRDREQAALAYKGITYRTEWPVIKPELNVDLTKGYDTLVIEHKNNYQSPDNQYVKSTDFATEVYVETGATSDAETLGDKIRAWMA